MNIAVLGSLARDLDVPEWLVSKPVSVPYFDGLGLTFTLDGLDEDDTADAGAAIESFLRLSATDPSAASPYVFEYYRWIAAAADPDELGCRILSEHDVWNYVRATAVFVSRRDRRDREIYVQITARCDWEPEHGMQIVYRRGAILSRVSERDGHLRYADAFDVSDDQDRIV